MSGAGSALAGRPAAGGAGGATVSGTGGALSAGTGGRTAGGNGGALSAGSGGTTASGTGGVPSAGSGGTTPGNVIFFDDFVGTSVDSSKWTVVNRISDQANGELNCCVPANVSVSGGLLRGVSKFEDYTCGDSELPSG